MKQAVEQFVAFATTTPQSAAIGPAVKRYSTLDSGGQGSDTMMSRCSFFSTTLVDSEWDF